MKKFILLASSIIMFMPTQAQRLLTDVLDTTTLEVRKLKILSEKYGNLSFSGYLQPQFQIAQQKGTDAEYQGGSFAANSNNRFRLRRGRLRADYIFYHEDGSPSTFFVFQFDGTEQGVNIRDFWGRYYENKLKSFAFSGGMMARPFGFELQLSSAMRESPERGRMSQILMKTERDLGFNITFNPRDKRSKYRNLQIDLGVFNGQGLAGPREYDNKKDIIARIARKTNRIKPGSNFRIGGGVSALLGGIASETNTLYTVEGQNNTAVMQANTADDNMGKTAPRHYYGADIEIETASDKWKSEIRAEYIMGLQTGTATNSSTPGIYPVEKNVKQPLYTRPFDGAYFYFIQNLGTTGTQLVLKYDWYDPNTKIKGLEVSADKGFTKADVKYNTFGAGLLHYVNPHLKVFLYYDMIKNENTQISGFTKDVHDNIFTLRTQFSF